MQTGSGAFAWPLLDGFSAIGVRRDGAEISFLQGSKSPPVLTRFAPPEEPTARGWTATEVPGMMLYRDLGVIDTVNRHNELRYVTADRFVFVGVFVPFEGHPEAAGAFEVRTISSAPPLPLDGLGPRRRGACLMLGDLTARTVTPVIRVGLDGSGERGSFSMGGFSVSSDGRWLYVACVPGIARVPISALRSRP